MVANMNPAEMRLVALRSLINALEAVLATGKHNLDSKLRAHSLSQILAKMRLERSPEIGGGLCCQATEILQRLTALGYFEKGSLVSAISTPSSTLTHPEEEARNRGSTLRRSKSSTRRSPRPNRSRKRRKLGQSSKPHLIFSGAFESSRRRH